MGVVLRYGRRELGVDRGDERFFLISYGPSLARRVLIGSYDYLIPWFSQLSLRSSLFIPRSCRPLDGK